MKDVERRTGWKFWLGLAAGVAAGWYLNSTKGRKLRAEVGTQLNEWGEDLNERARTGFKRFSETASGNLEKSKTMADQMRTNLKDKIEMAAHSAEEMVDRTEMAYEKAADWAKDKLDAKNTAK